MRPAGDPSSYSQQSTSIHDAPVFLMLAYVILGGLGELNHTLAHGPTGLPTLQYMTLLCSSVRIL